MEIRVVPHGSADYWASVELRREVLRRPLGLEYAEADLLAEGDSIHLVAFDQGEAVATLMLTPVDGRIVKMRQVAVHPGRQRTGLGRRLVDACEALARERGFGEIVLHARQLAVPFYDRLGYEVFGEPFEEVGLPHRKMRKRL